MPSEVVDLLIIYLQNTGPSDWSTKEACRQLASIIWPSLSKKLSKSIRESPELHRAKIKNILNSLYQTDPIARQLVQRLSRRKNMIKGRSQNVTVIGDGSIGLAAGRDMKNITINPSPNTPHSPLEIFAAIKNKGAKSMELSPESQALALSFLFNVGRLAISQLRERWRLSRQSKNTLPNEEGVDISIFTEDAEQKATQILQEVVMQYGVKNFEIRLQLITRKNDLVFEWQESKVDLEEEYNRQLITRYAYRLRKKEMEAKISATLAEIENELTNLGLTIKKEALD